MTDIAVTARFLRAMQPLQYEKAEAEITVSGTATSEADAARFMDQAQRIALAAVGKSHEFRPAAGSPPVTNSVVPTSGGDTSRTEGAVGSGTEAPKVEEKKPVGRPRKVAAPAVVPTQDALEAALADAAGKPEPSAETITETAVDVKVNEADLPAVTDEELQTACATAAEKITAAKVKGLYAKNYKVDRVAEIEAEFRRPFLKDLATLVAKESK